jgi:hypothetical protein
MRTRRTNMNALSEQEMTTLLGLIAKASHDQLRRVFETAKLASDLRSRQATVGIQVGAKVKWNGKHGQKTGTVKKIKQKYVEVVEDGQPSMMFWNVPAGMLTVVP